MRIVANKLTVAMWDPLGALTYIKPGFCVYWTRYSNTRVWTKHLGTKEL